MREVGLLPPAYQPHCLVTTPAEDGCFSTIGSVTVTVTLLFCTWQSGNPIFSRNFFMRCVFCLVTESRAQFCCSTWWRPARGNAGVTRRHTGSLNLWEQQRETLRRGSSGRGLQHPAAPPPFPSPTNAHRSRSLHTISRSHSPSASCCWRCRPNVRDMALGPPIFGLL